MRHLCGFMPVCIRLCSIRSPMRVNNLLHVLVLHIYGRSPVCIRMWALKLNLEASFLWQILHSITLTLFRSGFVKDFSTLKSTCWTHLGYLTIYLRLFAWAVNSLSVLDDLPQILHTWIKLVFNLTILVALRFFKFSHFRLI